MNNNSNLIGVPSYLRHLYNTDTGQLRDISSEKKQSVTVAANNKKQDFSNQWIKQQLNPDYFIDADTMKLPSEKKGWRLSSGNVGYSVDAPETKHINNESGKVMPMPFNQNRAKQALFIAQRDGISPSQVSDEMIWAEGERVRDKALNILTEGQTNLPQYGSNKYNEVDINGKKLREKMFPNEGPSQVSDKALRKDINVPLIDMSTGLPTGEFEVRQEVIPQMDIYQTGDVGRYGRKLTNFRNSITGKDLATVLNNPQDNFGYDSRYNRAQTLNDEVARISKDVQLQAKLKSDPKAYMSDEFAETGTGQVINKAGALLSGIGVVGDAALDIPEFISNQVSKNLDETKGKIQEQFPEFSKTIEENYEASFAEDLVRNFKEQANTVTESLDYFGDLFKESLSTAHHKGKQQVTQYELGKDFDDNEGFFNVAGEMIKTAADNPNAAVDTFIESIPQIAVLAKNGAIGAAGFIGFIGDRATEAEKIFIKEHGREPNADEYRNIIGASIVATGIDKVQSSFILDPLKKTKLGEKAVSKLVNSKGADTLKRATDAINKTKVAKVVSKVPYGKTAIKAPVAGITEPIQEGSQEYLKEISGKQTKESLTSDETLKKTAVAAGQGIGPGVIGGGSVQAISDTADIINNKTPDDGRNSKSNNIDKEITRINSVAANEDINSLDTITAIEESNLPAETKVGFLDAELEKITEQKLNKNISPEEMNTITVEIGEVRSRVNAMRDSIGLEPYSEQSSKSGLPTIDKPNQENLSESNSEAVFNDDSQIDNTAPYQEDTITEDDLSDAKYAEFYSPATKSKGKQKVEVLEQSDNKTKIKFDNGNVASVNNKYLSESKPNQETNNVDTSSDALTPNQEASVNVNDEFSIGDKVNVGIHKNREIVGFTELNDGTPAVKIKTRHGESIYGLGSLTKSPSDTVQDTAQTDSKPSKSITPNDGLTEGKESQKSKGFTDRKGSELQIGDKVDVGNLANREVVGFGTIKRTGKPAVEIKTKKGSVLRDLDLVSKSASSSPVTEKSTVANKTGTNSKPVPAKKTKPVAIVADSKNDKSDSGKGKTETVANTVNEKNDRKVDAILQAAQPEIAKLKQQASKGKKPDLAKLNNKKRNISNSKALTDSEKTKIIASLDKSIEDINKTYNQPATKPVVNKTVAPKTEKKSVRKTVNKAVVKSVNDYIWQPYKKTLDKVFLDEHGDFKQGKLATVLSAPVAFPYHIASGKFAEKLNDFMYKVTDKDNTIHKLTREMAGDRLEDTELNKLARHARHEIETKKLNTRNLVSKQIQKSFDADKKITKSDWEDITAAILKADVSSLVSDTENLTDLIKLMKSKQHRLDTIAQLEKELNKYGSKGKVSLAKQQAESLGHYMAKGKAGMPNQMLNVDAIAKITGMDGIANDLLDTLDKLVSVWALEFTNRNALTNTAKIIQHEAGRNLKGEAENGIQQLLNLHKNFKQESLEKNFDNNPMNTIKGYIKESYDNNKSLVIDTKANKKKLAQDGYKPVSKTPIQRDKTDVNQEEMFLYISRSHVSDDYLNGLLNLNTTKAKGSSSIKSQLVTGDSSSFRVRKKELQEMYNENKKLTNQAKAKRIIDYSENYAIPTLDADGSITDYRYVMSEGAKQEHLDMSNQANNTLGEMYGDIISKGKGELFNNQTIKELKKDFDSYYSKSPREFVKLNNDETKLLPQAVRKSIRDVWGKQPLMMRQEIKDLILGYQKLSVLNSLDKSFVGQKLSDNVGYQLATLAARKVTDLYKAAVGAAKRRIIVLNLDVVMGNYNSNLNLLYLRGVSLNNIRKDMTEGHRLAIKYEKDLERRDTLKLKMDSNPKLKSSKAANIRLDKLNKMLEKNPIHILFDEGLFQNIVEDININDSGALDKVASILGASKGLDFASDITPKAVKSVASNMVMASGSTIGNAADYITKISDFVARYALYKHLTQRDGMSHDKAITEAVESFINYDVPTSQVLQWANEMGALMFTKFALRILRPLAKMATTTPANIVASEVMQEVIMGMDDVYDYNALSTLEGSRTLTPKELTDKLSEVPLINLIPGL